ncbi:50S ribosomal protein L3 [Candidatus Woesearchaeota archaeon]|nr:50S ribosomal protein L3 [Candidatus Woesearchaeota archaeon]
MPKAHSPRHGSMQFWPRKLAKRVYSRVRSWPKQKEGGLLGFSGYKAGMTQALVVDNRKTSTTKGQQITVPITVIECPPIKIASSRFYKKTTNGLKLISEVYADKVDKELSKKLPSPKKPKKRIDDIKEFDDIRVNVYTQPKLTGIGKKKPEIYEVGLGGSKEDKLNFVKENLGKEIKIGDVFKEGEQLDLHCVTKGKGYQGPVKRFGIQIRHHKSEKTKRGPGSLGGWTCQQHVMPRVPHAGKTGYNTRTEYNKLLLRIGNKAEEINPSGGFVNYGMVKNDYLLIKGSIAGAKNRIVRIVKSIRPNKLIPKEAPAIQEISLLSKQR